MDCDIMELPKYLVSREVVISVLRLCLLLILLFYRRYQDHQIIFLRHNKDDKTPKDDNSSSGSLIPQYLCKSINNRQDHLGSSVLTKAGLF